MFVYLSFYLYTLMVLPTLVYNTRTIYNWLWWYPPHLRGMRMFRLRRYVGYLLLWIAFVSPTLHLFERSQYQVLMGSGRFPLAAAKFF